MRFGQAPAHFRIPLLRHTCDRSSSAEPGEQPLSSSRAGGWQHLTALRGEREDGGLRKVSRAEDQCVVDRLCAKLVLHNAEAPAGRAGQHTVEQRRLPGSEESGHDSHRQPTAQAGAALRRHDLRVGEAVVDVPVGLAGLTEDAHNARQRAPCDQVIR